MGWTFFNYLSERGTDEIEAWEDTLPAKAVARVEWLLSVLRGVPQLKRPYVGVRKNYPEHYELVVTSCGREFRPLGCYGPAKQQFTLLIGAEEKGGSLIPKSADSTADERRKIVMKDPKRARNRE
jgi:hypothetical protein